MWPQSRGNTVHNGRPTTGADNLTRDGRCFVALIWVTSADSITPPLEHTCDEGRLLRQWISVLSVRQQAWAILPQNQETVTPYFGSSGIRALGGRERGDFLTATDRAGSALEPSHGQGQCGPTAILANRRDAGAREERGYNLELFCMLQGSGGGLIKRGHVGLVWGCLYSRQGPEHVHELLVPRFWYPWVPLRAH